MKKHRFYLFCLGLTLLVWEATGCGSAKQVQGTYQVTGSAGVTANITYALSGPSGLSQVNNQALPWSTTFTGTETEGGYTGSYVYLSATNDESASSSTSVTITILENGSRFQQPNYVQGGGQSVTLFGYF